MTAKKSGVQIVEQLFCAAVGVVFLYSSLRFFNRKEQEGKAFILLCIAAGWFFCTLSSVQTFIKTGILWKVDTDLTEYMNKIDGFQTNVTAMRDDLSKQQSLLKSNQNTMESQITNFQGQILSTRTEITNQLGAIKSLGDSVSAQEKHIDFVDVEVRSNEVDLNTRQLEAENEIKVFQNQMGQTRQQITNQLQTVQDIGGKLNIAETNLESQQKELGNVDSVIRNLYKDKVSETFGMSDTNSLLAIPGKKGAMTFVARLTRVPMENSLECYFSLYGGTPQRAFVSTNTQNLCWFSLFNFDTRAIRFLYFYAVDKSDTNVFGRLPVVNKEVWVKNNGGDVQFKPWPWDDSKSETAKK